MTLQAIEVWTEERSMKRALEILLPRMLPGVHISVYNARNKLDLLTKLPGLLDAYSRWVTAAQTGVVVVVDQDQDQCAALIRRMDDAATSVGLRTTSVSDRRSGDVLHRIAVEELEAWFLGDVDALAKAYPGLPPSLSNRARFRDPDAVTGGTWESLERVLQKAGHHQGGLRKIRLAEDVAPRMDISRNRSYSFNKFRDGIQLLAKGAA